MLFIQRVNFRFKNAILSGQNSGNKTHTAFCPLEIQFIFQLGFIIFIHTSEFNELHIDYFFIAPLQRGIIILVFIYVERVC